MQWVVRDIDGTFSGIGEMNWKATALPIFLVVGLRSRDYAGLHAILEVLEAAAWRGALDPCLR